MTIARSATFLVLVLSVIAISVTATLYTAYQSASEVNATWKVLGDRSSVRERSLRALRRALGFGAMIHDFKNYVLRQDQPRIERIHRAMGAALAATQRYRGSSQLPEETTGLDAIDAMISAYGEALRMAIALVAEGATVSEVDAAVAVSDQAALAALDTLETIVATSRRSTARTRMDQLERLEGALGYGGMIHRFKNVVIRRDLARVLRVEAAIAAVRTTIDEYRTYEISVAERRALVDIGTVVDAYERNLDLAVRLINQGHTPKQIDTMVKIDDNPAITALTTLAAEIGAESERASTEMLDLLDRKIDLLGGLAIAFPMLLCGITVGIYLFARRGIVGPVTGLSRLMRALADGDLEVDLTPFHSRSEIGAMAKAVEVFRGNAVYKRQQEIEEAERLEREARAVAEQHGREQAMGEEIADLVSAVANGDLSRRLNLEEKNAFYRSLSERMNRLTETVDQLVRDIGEVLASLAAGDLTRQLDNDYQGAFGAIQQNLNATITKLAEIVGRIGGTAQSISRIAADVATGSGDLSERTEEQASSLEETAASTEQLDATVRANAQKAERASAKATHASHVARDGSQIATTAVEAIQRIAEASGRITEIIGVIDEIAFQTNLLALNAAVEAARAGDAGKGFAVVAQEVRILAQRSAQASKEIKGLILASDAEVNNGVEMVKKAGAALQGIVSAVQEVADLIHDIAAASKEQAAALEEVNATVSSLDAMTQKNAAMVEQTTAAAQSLDNQAQEQRRLVAFFRLGTDAPDLGDGPKMRGVT